MKRLAMSEYGKKVKIRLVELEMTQVELAEELGISKQYLTTILSGRRSGKTYMSKIDSILHLDKEIA